MDITTDGFGFMLAIGDLAWVPFTYTLQARYLAFNPVRLSTLHIAAILATEATGYYIFRASNWEKDSFRSGRNPRSESKIQQDHRAYKIPYVNYITSVLVDLEFIQTKKGSKLLTSGWWGRSRHPVSLFRLENISITGAYGPLLCSELLWRLAHGVSQLPANRALWSSNICLRA